MAERNPRYWASQWYSTKFDEEPWPGGWYWHDERYNWSGPYEDEETALQALDEHRASLAEASRETKPAPVSHSLYCHPLSTYSQKVLIALYEKDIPFERKIVDFMNPEERARYRKMYPLGKIPLLVLSHGAVIPESSIIIEYLDSLGGARLISEDPDVARKTRFKDRIFDLYLNDSLQTLLFQSLKPKEKRSPKRIETAEYRIKAVYDFMEAEIGKQMWANGPEFSMSDCAAAPALFYARDLMPFDRYANIVDYAERLAERPSVRRTEDEAIPYVEAFKRQQRAS